MSDTASMVRLMEHAADHLRSSVDDLKKWAGGSQEVERDQRKAIASMAYARGVLQMVAASVAPEGNKVVENLLVDGGAKK